MIKIKRANDDDAAVLTDLGIRTFTETFAKDNSAGDIDLYLAQTFAVEKQLGEIRDPKRRIEIAWIGNQPAGFLHLLDGIPDPSILGERTIEILRLYVDSRWHGKGVGAALMDRSLELAREEGFETIWLGVWEENHRAQAFYRKYEFEAVGTHIFRLGNDEQTDLILNRKL